MVLPSAHGAHPDGDPFEAIDAARNSNTALGRMEARAREEGRIAEGGLPSASTPLNQPLRSKRNTPSLYGSPRMAKDLAQQQTPAQTTPSTSTITTTTTPKLPSKQSAEVIVVDDSDDSQPKEVVIKPSSSASNSKGNGKAKEIIKLDEDIVMSEADVPVISSGSLTPIESNNLPSKDIEMEPPAASTSAATTSAVILPSQPVSESDPAQIPSAAGPAAPSRAPRRSLSPPPAKKIKRPAKTIRLEINMGGFDVTGVPEFSIADMAIEAGYDEDSSSEEEEDDDDGKSGSGSGSDSGSEDEEGNKKKKEKGEEVAEGEVEGEGEGEGEGEVEGDGDADSSKAEKDDAMEGVEAAVPNGDPSSNVVPAVVEVRLDF